MNCPLCHSSNSRPFSVPKKPAREYFLCLVCDLIWMDSAQWLKKESEKERYDHHENEDAPGYRQFLEPLIQEIRTFSEAKNKSGAEAPRPFNILDFGCGPTANMTRWLKAEGFTVLKYDLFYFPDQGPLQKPYDVIVSTEVWEHFKHPREEIDQLVRLLKPEGIFAIATAAHPVTEESTISAFHDWYYRRDLTHVVFYSHKTMSWIANNYGLTLTKAASPYWILQKPSASSQQ